MGLIGEKAKRAYWFIMIMLFALMLGLIFSAIDLGKGIDGLTFDRISPLLGVPQEVHHYHSPLSCNELNYSKVDR